MNKYQKTLLALIIVASAMVGFGLGRIPERKVVGVVEHRTIEGQLPEGQIGGTLSNPYQCFQDTDVHYDDEFWGTRMSYVKRTFFPCPDNDVPVIPHQF